MAWVDLVGRTHNWGGLPELSIMFCAVFLVLSSPGRIVLESTPSLDGGFLTKMHFEYSSVQFANMSCLCKHVDDHPACTCTLVSESSARAVLTPWFAIWEQALCLLSNKGCQLTVKFTKPFELFKIVYSYLLSLFIAVN